MTFLMTATITNQNEEKGTGWWIVEKRLTPTNLMELINNRTDAFNFSSLTPVYIYDFGDCAEEDLPLDKDA